MNLKFIKMHGTGNDFVMIDDPECELDLSVEAISLLCDRHFGIGADGIILVRPAKSDEADCFMLYYNSDGTTAEMCGNGVRCFAKFVVDYGLAPVNDGKLRIETLGGLKPVQCLYDKQGKVNSVCVDMGAPILRPEEVPTTLAAGLETAIGSNLVTEVGSFKVNAISMGNPHCIIFVDDPDDADVETIGPVVEVHGAFPHKTNVEFATVVSPKTYEENVSRILLRVWERGVGETLACGTGACATLVAAALTNRCGKNATVQLPGGELDIKWAENDHVYMTGPACEVFSGSFFISE